MFKFEAPEPLRKAWSWYRQIAAVRGLLQWTGWWESVIAFFTAAAFAIGSAIKGLPWPVSGLIFLLIFAVFSFIWRMWSERHFRAEPVGMLNAVPVSEARREPGDPPKISISRYDIFGLDRDAYALFLTNQGGTAFDVQPESFTIGDHQISFDRIYRLDKGAEAISRVRVSDKFNQERHSIAWAIGKRGNIESIIIHVEFGIRYRTFDDDWYTSIVALHFDLYTSKLTPRFLRQEKYSP